MKIFKKNWVALVAISILALFLSTCSSGKGGKSPGNAPTLTIPLYTGEYATGHGAGGEGTFDGEIWDCWDADNPPLWCGWAKFDISGLNSSIVLTSLKFHMYIIASNSSQTGRIIISGVDPQVVTSGLLGGTYLVDIRNIQCSGLGWVEIDVPQSLMAPINERIVADGQFFTVFLTAG